MSALSPRQRVTPTILLAGALSLAILIALAASCSVAKASGVHFDPNSPAGKEYALPLPQARNEAIGGSNDESGATAPLFGIGISRRGSEGGAARRGDTSTGQALAGLKGTLEKAKRTAHGNHRPTSESSAVRPLSGDGGYPLIGGVVWVAAIILVGVGLALALQRADARRDRLRSV